MERWRTLLDAIGLGLLFAGIGGIAKAARNALSGGYTWRQLLLGIVVSAFTGILVQLLIHESGMTPTMQAAVVAVSGYMGGAAIDLLVEVVTDIIKRQGPK